MSNAFQRSLAGLVASVALIASAACAQTAIRDAETSSIVGLIAGSLCAGSVTRVMVRLEDGPMVTVDALGRTSVTGGAPVGVISGRRGLAVRS